MGAASFKLKETTSISTSGASSPPRADNDLSRTRFHIKHSHVKLSASRKKFTRRTYRNVPVEIPRFFHYLLFVFYSFSRLSAQYLPHITIHLAVNT